MYACGPSGILMERPRLLTPTEHLLLGVGLPGVHVRAVAERHLVRDRQGVPERCSDSACTGTDLGSAVGAAVASGTTAGGSNHLTAQLRRVFC